MIKMKKRKILSVLAAIAMAVTALPADFLSVYAESNVTEEYEEIIPDVQRDEELDSFSQPEYSPMFSFPDEVRGVYITPEKDFDIYDKNGDMLSEEDILAGINSALDSAENMSLNTVIINTSYNGNVYFSTDMNGRSCAHRRQMSVECSCMSPLISAQCFRESRRRPQKQG